LPFFGALLLLKDVLRTIGTIIAASSMTAIAAVNYVNIVTLPFIRAFESLKAGL